MPYKICTVLGARPQFIKASIVSKKIDLSRELKEVIIHTGQHFDENMSDSFFKELAIKSPKYNLGIHSKSHGSMTGEMIIQIEKILLDEKPDLLLVYGDTDSTLAAALAAIKIDIPIAHVEAGLRSYNMKMPEEINRILTDRVSDILFTPSKNAIEILKQEGINIDNIIETGDVMYDLCLDAQLKLGTNPPSKFLDFYIPNDYALLTLHRKENSVDKNELTKIFSYINEYSNDKDIIWPVHPRIKEEVNNFFFSERVHLIDPVKYFEMMHLIQGSSVVLTDSGGLQKEAFFFSKPCYILREETEWIELLNLNWALLADFKSYKKFKKGLNDLLELKRIKGNPFGHGNASNIIVKELISRLKKK